MLGVALAGLMTAGAAARAQDKDATKDAAKAQKDATKDAAKAVKKDKDRDPNPDNDTNKGKHMGDVKGKHKAKGHIH